MKVLQSHARLSFGVLYVLAGAWFAAFDLTLKFGALAMVKNLGIVLLTWPALPVYDLVSGNPELMIEGAAEILAISAVFYAWYRLSRPALAKENVKA